MTGRLAFSPEATYSHVAIAEGLRDIFTSHNSTIILCNVVFIVSL
jgi:hypothetical protein